MILNEIEDRIGDISGNIGIYFINLATGKAYFTGNCKVFPASGAAKLMILIETFKQLEHGIINKKQIYKLKSSDYIKYTPTYGALNYLHEGLELTVEDLYKLAITVSDNMAFNILVDLLGMDKINETFMELGYCHMKINRKILDMEAMNQGIENYISVKEIAIIFERLYKGQIISESASSEMLDLLTLHQRTNVMPYYFPEEMKIAHQTGFDNNVIIDAGIVFGSEPFVLSMAASNIDIRKAETMMRDITLICYNTSNE